MKWLRSIAFFIVLLIGLLFIMLPMLITKEDIEAKLSNTTQKEVRFDSYGLSLFPTTGLKLENLRYKDRNNIDIKIKKLIIKLNPFDLLNIKNLKIETIYIIEPTIKIHTSSTKKSSNEKINLIDIKSLHIQNAKVTYNNTIIENIHTIASIKNSIINLQELSTKTFLGFQDLQLSGSLDINKKEYKLSIKANKYSTNNSSNATSKQTKKTDYSSLVKDLNANVELSISDVTLDKVFLSNLNANIILKNSILDIKPITFFAYRSKSTGVYRIDLRKKEPQVKLTQTIPKLNIETLFDKEKSLKGFVNIKVDATFKGDNKQRIFSTLRGTKSLTGKNLSLTQYNIDELLKMYEETQKVNVLDIGAMFVAGPFAGLLTQSGKFALLKEKLDKKGSTHIKAISSVWKLENKKATTKDVAIRTTNNLIAIKGVLDLESLRYKDMNIAVLDKKRCIKYNQLLTGDLKKGTIDIKESKVETFLSPVTSLIKGAVSLFGGKDECKPFYTGSVKW